MEPLLWLLLPVAAASGWIAARRNRPPQHRWDAMRNLPTEYIQGLNYLLTEQPDKALEVFIRVVEVDLDTFETHLALGNLFRRRGETDRAIRVHNNLVNRPQLESALKARALVELARDYLKAGLLDRAEALLHEVVPYGSQNREAYQHLRDLYEQEKDWHSAIQAAGSLQGQTGRSEAPIIAHYYCELSVAAAEKGDAETAVSLARKALAQDPDCARANLLLGDYARNAGNGAEALDRYQHLHAQDPRLIPLTLERVKQSCEQGNGVDSCLPYLIELHERTGNVSLLLFLIDLLKELGRESDIDRLLDAALSNNPHVPLVLVREYVRRKLGNDLNPLRDNLLRALETHSSDSPAFQCHNCGLGTKRMFWQCPGCHGWGTVKPAEA